MDAHSIGNQVDPHFGEACINDELVDKNCDEMTNLELADFIDQGAWRRGVQGWDESAYREAAKRLRKRR